MTKVRIGTQSRRMARKLLLDPDHVYVYWFSKRDQTTLHHFVLPDHAVRTLPVQLHLEYDDVEG